MECQVFYTVVLISYWGGEYQWFNQNSDGVGCQFPDTLWRGTNSDLGQSYHPSAGLPCIYLSFRPRSPHPTFKNKYSSTHKSQVHVENFPSLDFPLFTLLSPTRANSRGTMSTVAHLPYRHKAWSYLAELGKAHRPARGLGSPSRPAQVSVPNEGILIIALFYYMCLCQGVYMCTTCKQEYVKPRSWHFIPWNWS